MTYNTLVQKKDYIIETNHDLLPEIASQFPGK
ncbi:DhNV_105 [Dikerogammarus haemobaphes nudivirus]|nr:DhNV_105 [Dikerogammarus haemobaphes nudivirus]